MASKVTRAQSARVPPWITVLVSVFAASVLVATLAQPAAAATYHRYQNGPSAENEYHSWTGTDISGGWQSLNILTAEFHMYQDTHSGFGGGYVKHGYSITTAPGGNAWAHTRYQYSATSSCYWYLPELDVEGDLKHECRAKRY